MTSHGAYGKDEGGVLRRHNMAIERIAVLGAGQMGNGITQVAACAGYEVLMIDIEQQYVENGINTIKSSLDRLVAKDRMSADNAESALARISIHRSANGGKS
jgi:3-hydroxybutyryl-CoA dehydrogenase